MVWREQSREQTAEEKCFSLLFWVDESLVNSGEVDMGECIFSTLSAEEHFKP